MNHEEIRAFQIAQKEIVAMIGAFLVPLKSFRDSLSTAEGKTIDLAVVRRLQPMVSDFMSWAINTRQIFDKYHYKVYQAEIFNASNGVAILFGNQTLPSKQLDRVSFKAQLDSRIEAISEVMIATAQIVTPSVDANVRAGNAFSAYCLISSMIDGTTSELILVDPYIDQSVFYRYLYRLPKETKIKIVTDKDKLKGTRLKEFESVEVLFESEYPNYTRVLRGALHDRYLINEANAYSLGGSIKDAAKQSDYSIVQLTEEKRTELCALYA